MGGLFRFPHQFEPRSLSESGIPSILALIPRCCTEKISVLARWMICAQNNASEIIFEANGGRRGGFFFCSSLFLAAWDSAVAGPAWPSEPPISAARHFFFPSRFASVRACQGFIPVQTKRPPDWSPRPNGEIWHVT